MAESTFNSWRCLEQVGEVRKNLVSLPLGLEQIESFLNDIIHVYEPH